MEKVVSDAAYMMTVMTMDEDKRRLLMKNEAARKRTFAYLWPKTVPINYGEFAREGFYYTGIEQQLMLRFLSFIQLRLTYYGLFYFRGC